MKQWMLAAVTCVCIAPMAHAASLSDCTDDAIGWCEQIAHRVEAIQPGAAVRGATTAIRAYAASAKPGDAAALGREMGLQLPAMVDASRPMVVLVHGLDMDQGDLLQLDSYLVKSGMQVARFGYPADGPVADDAALFGEEMAKFSAAHPGMKVDVVAYSMGSLVARDYVEGPTYGGHVDHLILLAPPNHGSNWAPFEPLLKVKHDWAQARVDVNWRASWMVTEGLCEASEDLTPHSSFLTELNDRPRRAGVRYTIVEGDEHMVRRIAADALSETAGLISRHVPQKAATVSVEFLLANTAASVADHHDNGDGAVTLASASLPGVSDVVTVHADHGTIFWPDALGHEPAAWPVVVDRLRR